MYHKSLDLEEHESKSVADRRAIQMAKAYGGEPPVKKDKKKKTTDKKPAVPKTLDDFRPPTDRLFPSLLLQQE